MEGRVAGQQEVGGGAQAVDVGADVHVVAVHDLLGGEVVVGADNALPDDSEKADRLCADER